MGSTGKQEESAGREDMQAKGTAATPPYKSKGGRLGEAPAEVGGRGGGGGVQLAVRGGTADRLTRKYNGNSKIRDNRQVENSESSKNRSKNK